jgi:hypothetical protein
VRVEVLDRPGVDRSTVSQDGELVAQVEQFVQPVGDE